MNVDVHLFTLFIVFVHFEDITAVMKLITHNMLTSTIIKGVKKGFPLGITVSHSDSNSCLKRRNSYYRSTSYIIIITSHHMEKTEAGRKGSVSEKSH